VEEAKDDIRITIDAFADGETVDPVTLKEALATSDGRDYLVDVLVLRRFVLHEGTQGRSPWVAPIATVARRRWWPAAAVLAGIGVLGGYYAGRQMAPASALPATEVAAPIAAPRAPEPTRVIKLDESADWTDRSGGD